MDLVPPAGGMPFEYRWHRPESDPTKAELIRNIITQFGTGTAYYIDVSKANPDAVSRYSWIREAGSGQIRVIGVDTTKGPRFPREADIKQILCSPVPHPRHFLGLTIGGVHCPLVCVQSNNHNVNFYVEWDKAKFAHGMRVVMHERYARLRPNRGTGVVVCTHIETHEEREERYSEALRSHPMIAELLSSYVDEHSGFGDLQGECQLVKVRWNNQPDVIDTVYAHWIAATFQPK